MEPFQHLGPKICPFLGSRGDSETHFSFATEANYCHHVDPAEPVRISYQDSVCLTRKHNDCPVFNQAWEEALPPGIRRESEQADERVELKPEAWWGLLGGIGMICIALILMFKPFAKGSDEIAEQTSVAMVQLSTEAALPTDSQTQVQSETMASAPSPSPSSTQTASPALTATEVISPTTTTGTPTPTVTITGSAPTPGPVLMTPFGPNESYLVHQIKEGENLPILAQQYQTVPDVIIAVNGLPSGYSLQPGQVLIIMPGEKTLQNVESLLVLYLQQDALLSELAPRYGVSIEEIRQYSDLGPGETIAAGRWVIFPKRKVTPTLTTTSIPVPDLSAALTEPFGPNDEYVLHKVRPGDSIPILERLYLTSPEVIRAANVIEGSIRLDQVLVIIIGQTDPSGIQPFKISFVGEDIKVEDLAVKLSVLAADLINYNDLKAGEVISAGSWLIYPVAP